MRTWQGKMLSRYFWAMARYMQRWEAKTLVTGLCFNVRSSFDRKSLALSCIPIWRNIHTKEQRYAVIDLDWGLVIMHLLLSWFVYFKDLTRIPLPFYHIDLWQQLQALDNQWRGEQTNVNKRVNWGDLQLC